MRIALSLAFAVILFSFMAPPIHAQSYAKKLAEVAGHESPPDSVISKYRSLLTGAARYSESRSVVAEALLKAARNLREHGLSMPVRDLLSVDGLSGIVHQGRPFEQLLKTYLEYRYDRGLSHEEALEKLRSR